MRMQTRFFRSSAAILAAGFMAACQQTATNPALTDNPEVGASVVVTAYGPTTTDVTAAPLPQVVFSYDEYNSETDQYVSKMMSPIQLTATTAVLTSANGLRRETEYSVQCIVPPTSGWDVTYCNAGKFKTGSTGNKPLQVVLVLNATSKLKEVVDATVLATAALNDVTQQVAAQGVKLDTLQGEYGQLQTDYTNLNGNYNTLSGQYGQLQSDTTALRGDYNSLNVSYADLVSDAATQQASLDAIQDELLRFELGLIGTVELKLTDNLTGLPVTNQTVALADGLGAPTVVTSDAAGMVTFTSLPLQIGRAHV